MPAHTHTAVQGIVNSTAANGGGYTGQGYSMNTGSAGGGKPHRNMPPYIVLNYIIKT